MPRPAPGSVQSHTTAPAPHQPASTAVRRGPAAVTAATATAEVPAAAAAGAGVAARAGAGAAAAHAAITPTTAAAATTARAFDCNARTHEELWH